MPAEAPSFAKPFKLRFATVPTSVLAGVLAIASSGMALVLAGTFLGQVTRVNGPSMEPTLENHDFLLIDRLCYQFGTPQQGEIVTLYYPADPDRVLIKRVIATEHQSVRIVNGRVFVDDVPVRDDYVGAPYRSHENWGPEVVDDGYYFVLGDHRNDSFDSREWGFVPRRYVIGKVLLRWWPLLRFKLF